MHLPPLIQDLAIILAIAGLAALLCQRLHQPVILGYLISGIIVGPYTPPFSFVTDIPGIQTWAELGIIFLMFSLGLEFSFRKLSGVGKTAVITATFEVTCMFILGNLAGRLLGYNGLDSIVLGAMVSISSTTVIAKAFDELKLKSSHFALTTVGVLIIEDFFAMAFLIALPFIASAKAFDGTILLFHMIKFLLVFGSLTLFGYFVVRKFINYIGRDSTNESLIILSLGLCLSAVVLSVFFGYSAAMGAFLAGSVFADTNQIHRIEKQIKIFSDIFVAIFFVSIGMLLNFDEVYEHWFEIILLALLVIIGKIALVYSGTKLAGQKNDIATPVGFSFGQIGEFSFIIATFGFGLNLISPFLSSIAVSVCLITAFTTPYLIRYATNNATQAEKVPGTFSTLPR